MLNEDRLQRMKDAALRRTRRVQQRHRQRGEAGVGEEEEEVALPAASNAAIAVKEAGVDASVSSSVEAHTGDSGEKHTAARPRVRFADAVQADDSAVAAGADGSLAQHARTRAAQQHGRDGDDDKDDDDDVGGDEEGEHAHRILDDTGRHSGRHDDEIATSAGQQANKQPTRQQARAARVARLSNTRYGQAPSSSGDALRRRTARSTSKQSAARPRPSKPTETSAASHEAMQAVPAADWERSHKGSYSSNSSNSSSAGGGIAVNGDEETRVPLSEEIRNLLREPRLDQSETRQPVRRPHEDYERTIQRHLAFIDKLMAEKQELTEQCHKLAAAVEDIAKKSENKMKAMKHKHETELRSLGERLMKAEGAKRTKWMEAQKKKIKEATIRGLEPEIQRLIEAHKKEVEDLKAQHERELSSAASRDDAIRDRVKQEMRLELESEKQREIADQIASTKAFYRKQIESLEEDLQQQRIKFKRQLESTEQTCRETLDEERKRLQSEVEEAWAAVHERERRARLEASQEIAAVKARYEDDIRSVQKQAQIERESWEEILTRKQKAEVDKQVAAEKERLREERDREIERVIARLEEEMSTTHANLEASYNGRLAKLKETLSTVQARNEELEERMAQAEQMAAGEKNQQQQEIERLQTDLQRATGERDGIAAKMQKEFDEKELAQQKRIHELERQVLDQEQQREMEVSKLKYTHEKELADLKKDVEQALAKRDQTIADLRLEAQMAHRGISA